MTHRDRRSGGALRLTPSYRYYFAENATASIIFSLGTGNFIAGLLNWLGASPSTCAVIGAFPQLGCILQLVSPFLFERMKKRKTAVIACCFLFRFSLGLAGILPLLFSGNALQTVVPIYLIAFLAAGFVTPGLTQWIMDMAPLQQRGRFFAVRDMISSIANACVILLMSRLLDFLIAGGKTKEGYLMVFGTVTLLSLIDAVLLCHVEETVESKVTGIRLRDMLKPFRDRNYRPIILFVCFWFFVQNLSSGFLSVYQLTVLEMEHSMIAMMSVIATAVGICVTWCWGKFADMFGWSNLLVTGCLLTGVGYLGWFLLPARLKYLAPMLQCITVCGNSAYSMSFQNIQYFRCPQEGKTVYFGIEAALSNLIGYGTVCLGASVQPLLALRFPGEGIPVFFVCSAAGFLLCSVFAVKMNKTKENAG